MADPLLDVRGLGVQFPNAAARTPAHVDLRVRPGERVLVLGPSGSGKSSLLKSVAGVIPDIVDGDVYGDIEVSGIDHRAASVAQIARTVGFLGQDPLDQIALPRVDDEVAFGLENAGIPRDRIGPRVRAALSAVDAGHLPERSTDTLSGGQLQRVALAAVLAREPRLLLADEPAAMLDPRAAARIQRLLWSATPAGQAALVVDHCLEDVTDLPERVIVLDAGGTVVADGPATDVMCSHAERIADSGCWLPLGAEAALALGRTPTPSDLAGPESLLDELAGALPSTPIRENAPAAPALQATAASFAPARRKSPLVRDVSMALHRGTVTAIVGANGSGKTSLLLGLAGLIPTTGGEVQRDGHIGLVFQHPERQFLCRTVEDEIAYGAADRQTVERLLTELDLDGVRRSNPFQLSGGQQRRLSIAAVAATGASVVLLDEPTFGQDRLHAARLARTITDLAGHDGRAVAIVTHDLRLAAEIADHVAILADGRLLGYGATDDVLRDIDGLERAGVGTSRLLRWWAGRSDVPLRGLIAALHATVPVT